MAGAQGRPSCCVSEKFAGHIDVLNVIYRQVLKMRSILIVGSLLLMPASLALAATVHPDAGESSGKALRGSSTFNEAQYATASQLSVRPSPLGEIRVPSPDKATAREVVTTKVTLFIDANGSVAKVAFDDAALSRPFRDAVQSAFGKAHFKPGQINGRPVKARMRIEVTFEPRVETASTGERRPATQR